MRRWRRVRCDSTVSRVRRRRPLPLPLRAGKVALTEKLQDRQVGCRQSYWGPFQKSLQRSGWLLSFFDDGEETAPRPSSRAPRAGAVGDRPATGACPRRPRPPPRRPQGGGGDGGSLDQHTLMVRRLVAAGVAVVLVIVVALVINGCVNSEKKQSLKSYNQ